MSHLDRLLDSKNASTNRSSGLSIQGISQTQGKEKLCGCIAITAPHTPFRSVGVDAGHGMPCPYQMLSTAHRFGIVIARFSNQIALLPDDDDP